MTYNLPEFLNWVQWEQNNLVATPLCQLVQETNATLANLLDIEWLLKEENSQRLTRVWVKQYQSTKK